MGEIDQPDFIVTDLTGVTEGDIHAFGEELVEGVIIDDRILTGSALDMTDDFIDDGGTDRGGDVRIEAFEGGAKTSDEQDFGVGDALGGRFAGGDVPTVNISVTEITQPIEGSQFNGVFIEARHGTSAFKL